MGATASSLRSRSDLWSLAVLPAQVGLFLVVFRDHNRALLDDAYISFRYAVRWAEGLGLTYNDGSAVEGYSNPLWTLLLGCMARLGLAPHQVAPWLGLVGLLAATGVLLALGRRRGLSVGGLAILVAGSGLDVGIALWAGSGLETALAYLSVAAWLWASADVVSPTATFRRGLLLGVLGAALVLSRPEGLLWASWGLVWLIWGAWAPVRVLLGWGVGMLPALLYGGYRWVVFQQLVPNTYFAKVEPVALGLRHGVTDLAGWTLGHGVLVALVALLLLRIRKGSGKDLPGPPRWRLLVAGMFLIQAVFVLLVGGDWMGSTRYLAPVLPAFYLLVGELWSRAEPGRTRLSMATIIPVVLAAHLGAGWLTRDRIPDYTRQGQILGIWLRSAASPGDTLAVSAAGAIPYFSGLPTYDVLGITDADVGGRRVRHSGAWAPGHHRFDIDTLLRIRPRWIVWDYGVALNEHRLRKYRRWQGDPENLDYRESLLARPRFQELYVIDRESPAETQRAYTVFVRR